MRVCTLCKIDLAVFGILLNEGTRPNNVAGTNRHGFGNGRIDANEAVIAQSAVTGNNCMAGDKTKSSNLRMVADMVAAPKNGAVADL